MPDMSSSIALRGIRTGTPVPRIDREKSAKSPVVTYTLSPEELERYQSIGKPNSKRGVERMELTKEEYLNMRLQGLSRTQVYNTLGVKPPTLYNALERWGIKDRQVEDELLATMRETSMTEGTKPDREPNADESNVSSAQPVQNSVDKLEQPEPLDYVTIKIPLSFSNEPFEFFESDKPNPITRKSLFERSIQSINAAIEWAYRDMIELVGSDLAHEQIQKYVDKQMNEFVKAGESA